jgi:hypothetical protein
MAVMVVRAAKLDTVATGKVFTDEDKVSTWAKNSVITASSYEIIAGYPDNSFKPQGSVDSTTGIITPVAAGNTNISYAVKNGSRIVVKGSLDVVVQP